MKRIVVILILTAICLGSCTKSEVHLEEQLEDYLRQILPDQKPLNYLEVDENTASEFLLHIAVYHGIVHGHSTIMTTDEIMRNVEACSEVGVLLVDFKYAPAEYDDVSEYWIPYPHEPKYNLYYVIHDVEVSKGETFLNVQVSCIGFSEQYGLYTFSPDGEVQYEDGLRYRTFNDMDSLKEKILSEPEKYEIVSIGLQEQSGELYLSGFVWHN